MGYEIQAGYGNLAFAAQAPSEGEHQVALQILDGGLVGGSAMGRAQVLAADIVSKTSSKPESRRHALAMSLLAGALALVLFIGASSYCSARAARYDVYISSLDTTTLVVKSGESLWQIAEDHPIEGFDTAQTVSVLKTWNSLESSALQPGMLLVVPAR